MPQLPYGTPVVLVPNQLPKLSDGWPALGVVDPVIYQDVVSTCFGITPPASCRQQQEILAPSPPAFDEPSWDSPPPTADDPEQSLHIRRVCNAAVDSLLQRVSRPSPAETIDVLRKVFREAEYHYPQMKSVLDLSLYIFDKSYKEQPDEPPQANPQSEAGLSRGSGSDGYADPQVPPADRCA